MSNRRVAADAAWAIPFLEQTSDLVVLVAPDGTIQYCNDASQLWLGVPAQHWIGRNALETLHPDDAQRAVESLAYTFEHDEPVAPATFRVRTATGAYVALDCGADKLHTGRYADHVVLTCRVATNAQLADEFLEAVATGAPFDQILLLVTRTLLHPLWEYDIEIHVRNDGGDHVVTSAAPLEALSHERHDLELPWVVARRTGRDQIVLDLDHLPPDIRDAAWARGFQTCWAVAIEDPGADDHACLVVWSPEQIAPSLGQGVQLDRAKRLVGFALHEREQRRQLEHAARRDLVTGLANRVRLFHTLNAALDAHNAGSGTRPTMLFLDLDGFKTVNDDHGHATGDHVLRLTARRIAEVSDDAITVARVGGDEFAIVTSFEDERRVVDLAERLIDVVRVPLDLGGGVVVEFGVSVGIASALPTDTPESLLARADAAMYAAKRAGKGRWSISPS